ncbi:uncharacterized protein METZ01_LOCUS75019, partial [marine metagenome]
VGKSETLIWAYVIRLLMLVRHCLKRWEFPRWILARVLLTPC